MSKKTIDKEIDFLHWRLDQIQEMIKDLAMRLGQEDMAIDMTKFHNETVITGLNKMREES